MLAVLQLMGQIMLELFPKHVERLIMLLIMMGSVGWLKMDQIMTHLLTVWLLLVDYDVVAVGLGSVKWL